MTARAPSRSAISDAIPPVSYTHLDVYKRQIQAGYKPSKELAAWLKLPPVRGKRPPLPPNVLAPPWMCCNIDRIAPKAQITAARSQLKAGLTLGMSQSPIALSAEANARKLATVSYTHLDVYKRQPATLGARRASHPAGGTQHRGPGRQPGHRYPAPCRSHRLSHAGSSHTGIRHRCLKKILSVSVL